MTPTIPRALTLLGAPRVGRSQTHCSSCLRLEACLRCLLSFLRCCLFCVLLENAARYMQKVSQLLGRLAWSLTPKDWEVSIPKSSIVIFEYF